MYRTLFLVFFSVLIYSNTTGQGLELMGRFNAGIGLDYGQLDYFGSDVIYSAGGGMGFELGLIFPVNQFETLATVGYQQNLALQYESSTYGGTQETSFRFNRKFFSGGVNYKWYFLEGTFRGIKMGGGISYNFPGTYQIVENNDRFGNVKYNAALGYHLNLDFVLQLNTLELNPGIRFRNISYDVKSYEFGDVVDLEPELRNLDASGIDISLSIVKKIN